MFTRRQFLVRSAAAAASAHSFAQPAARSAQVKTPLGELRGEQIGGVRVFRGVPFAEPPTGALRFRPPQPKKPWSGVRDASRFGAAAIQPDEKNVEQSEDCLYLNIWAPAAGGPYPVFVWIHGGGFTGGRSFDSMSYGTGFAQEGIVCVSVAYRLGVLGFLALGPLLGPSYAGSANNAIRDLIEALTWVQKNIGAFGGDPARVTIGGESAGAKLTDMLAGCPAASPFFHGMISESGGAERIWPKVRAEGVAQDFGKAWSADAGRDAAGLAQAPARQMIEVQDRFQRSYPVHFPWRAEIDGALFPQAPLAAIRAGSTRGKRLLLGTNRDESASFLGPDPKSDPIAGDLGNLPLAQFQVMEQRYQQLYPEMPAPLRRIRSVTAEEYWVPSLRVADAHVAGGGTAFVYRFDYPGTGRYAGLAFHSYELRFVWDHFSAEESPDAEGRQLATQMHAAWAAFIRGGAPAARGLPAWPAYSSATRPTMLLDKTPHLENAPGATEFALWNGLLT